MSRTTARIARSSPVIGSVAPAMGSGEPGDTGIHLLELKDEVSRQQCAHPRSASVAGDAVVLFLLPDDPGGRHFRLRPAPEGSGLSAQAVVLRGDLGPPLPLARGDDCRGATDGDTSDGQYRRGEWRAG